MGVGFSAYEPNSEEKLPLVATILEHGTLGSLFKAIFYFSNFETEKSGVLLFLLIPSGHFFYSPVGGNLFFLSNQDLF